MEPEPDDTMGEVEPKLTDEEWEYVLAVSGSLPSGLTQAHNDTGEPEHVLPGGDA